MDIHVNRRPMTAIMATIIASVRGHAAFVLFEKANAHVAGTHHRNAWDWFRDLLKRKRPGVKVNAIGKAGNIDADRYCYH
jgi:hypothetical protein